MPENICRSCGSTDVEVFHELKSVPTNSCILIPSREEALHYPKGDILLGFCTDCGFISNTAFNPKLTEYSGRYEETQGFSSTFNAFHRELASRLIRRHDLHGKDIIEIGCGKGEFLSLLCKMGGNRGIGFDPAYINERGDQEAAGRVTFIEDFYSEKYADYRGDFIICKMTLEHIPTPFEFVSMVRRSIGEQTRTMVFFQVPDVVRILRDCAFEDIYYEHCSYFSSISLTRLFRKCGFEVLHQQTDYDDQYLMIEAKPMGGIQREAHSLGEGDDLEELRSYVNRFERNYQEKALEWKTRFQEFHTNGRRVVLWGSGSKAVAFLTSLDLDSAVDYVVDINPYRHEFFMAGTGQEIVAPEFLQTYRPDTVIVMNPIYREEIRRKLESLSLYPQITAL